MKTIKLLLQEFSMLKFVLSWRAIYDLLKRVCYKFFSFVFFVFYFFVALFIRIGINIKQGILFIWNWLANLISKFPKAFLIIFVILTIFNIGFFHVKGRMTELHYTKLMDSLVISTNLQIENSTYESGYAHALAEYSAYLMELDSENTKEREAKKIQAFIKSRENISNNIKDSIDIDSVK